jgi:hypothetical protein
VQRLQQFYNDVLPHFDQVHISSIVARLRSCIHRVKYLLSLHNHTRSLINQRRQPSLWYEYPVGQNCVFRGESERKHLLYSLRQRTIPFYRYLVVLTLSRFMPSRPPRPPFSFYPFFSSTSLIQSSNSHPTRFDYASSFRSSQSLTSLSLPPHIVSMRSRLGNSPTPVCQGRQTVWGHLASTAAFLSHQILG